MLNFSPAASRRSIGMANALPFTRKRPPWQTLNDPGADRPSVVVVGVDFSKPRCMR